MRHFVWSDDFAAARNHSFSQCAMDWVIWLDGDDVISPENQSRILDLKRNMLDDELEAIYLRYVYPPFEQWRERMARRDLFVKKLAWKQPIHEVIDGIDARKVRYFGEIAILHDTPPDRHALKKDRNISILRKHYASGATDDRSLFVYAVECLHSLLKEEGEQVLDRFFHQVKFSEYRYEICCKMYSFYAQFGELERAVGALSRAIAEDPGRAEAYYRLGRHLSDKADRRPRLFRSDDRQHDPDPKIGPRKRRPTPGPWEALCRAQFRLGNLAAARGLAAEALARKAPDAKWLGELARSEEPGPARELLPPQWRMDGRQPRQRRAALDDRSDPRRERLRPRADHRGSERVRPIVVAARRRPMGAGSGRGRLGDVGSVSLPPSAHPCDEAPCGIAWRVINLARCDLRDQDGARIHVGGALLDFRVGRHRACRSSFQS